MGSHDRLPALLAALSLIVMSTSGVWAGDAGSPDISDPSGDVLYNDNEPPATLPNNALQDSVDMTGVWFQFLDAWTLEVGVVVVNLNGQDIDEMAPDQGSLTYTVNFEFHRPGDENLSGWDAVGPTDDTATITTELDGDAPASCEEGFNATRSNGDNTVTCLFNSTTWVGSQYNGSFYSTDMIMNGSASSQGSFGAAQASDSASPDGGMAPVIFQDKEKPAGSDGDGGTGPGDDGGGNGGGGDGGDDGGGESTPGFMTVAATASLVGVALWARRRRD